MNLEIKIFQNPDMIYIIVSCSNEQPLSWELLQAVKNMYYPELSFVEVYPQKDKTINKANVRHLFHTSAPVPDMSDLEQPNFKPVLW